MCVYVQLKFSNLLVVFNTFGGILVNKLYFRSYSFCVLNMYYFQFPKPNSKTLITLTSTELQSTRE